MWYLPSPMSDDERTREKRTTYQGFATPDASAAAQERGVGPIPGLPDLPAEGPGGGDHRPTLQDLHARTPLVEIEVVHQSGPAPHTESPLRTLEVWTQNRVYTMDPAMICVRVTERASLEAIEDHPFLGQRMVGGQSTEGTAIELSYPFPRPGTEAVFEQADPKIGHFSRTSTVTRVVLRLHLISVNPSVVAPTWAEITSHTGPFPKPPTEP